MAATEAHGPLSGIRVLEFSQVVAGPFCGVMLADMGACVVKVEPLEGEPYRNQGAVAPNEGKRFQSLNRGKQSLAIDLHSERGRAVVQRLARQTDVIVVNYRSGVARRLGIDYETLSAINPGLIYCRITGFGVKSAAAEWPATDPMMQAYSGLMVAGGQISDDGLPKGSAGTAVADYTAGLGAAAAICAALYSRRADGHGQLIDASLLRAALVVQDTQIMREPVSDVTLRDPIVRAVDEIRLRGGSYREMIEKRDSIRSQSTTLRLYSAPYQARDGVIMLGALTPNSRAAARRALRITDDPTAQPIDDLGSPAVAAQLQTLKRYIEAAMRERTVAEWMAEFEAEGVPAAPVNFPERMADDPIVQAEQVMWNVVHDVLGPQRVVGPLFQMSRTPTAVQGASPPLGSHTQRLLAETGFTSAEIEQLLEDEVVRSCGTT